MTKPAIGSNGSSPTLTVAAPAKVNLILRVLDRRTDGYHNLWSLMQTVGVADELTLSHDPHHSAIRLQCDQPSLKTDSSNLVYRAAAAVLQHGGLTVGLDIRLAKRIPMGAGLGGGSSDAAATIMGLNRLLRLGWSAEKMAEIGQGLGSDVPFFMFAPTAIVAGRGEQVAPVRISGTRWVLLVNPGFEVETKWAYQQLSATRAGVQPISDAHQAIGKGSDLSWEQIMQTAENDFETPVFKAFPTLQQIKQQLLAEGAEAALLSGSGATVFGVFPDEATARQAQNGFRAEPQFKVFVTSTALDKNSSGW